MASSAVASVASARPASPFSGSGRGSITPRGTATPAAPVSFRPVISPSQPATIASHTGVVIPPTSFRSAVVFVQGAHNTPVAVLRKPGVAQPAVGEEATYVHLTSGAMYRQIVRTDLAALPVIRIIGQPAGSDINVNYTTAVWYAASDISAVARNIIFGFVQPDNPNPGVTLGLGYTSAGGLITGPLVTYAAYQQLKQANVINDVAGRQIAQIKLAQGVLETTSGAVMTSVRTMGLVGLNTTSKTVVAANLALGITSTVTSSVLFSLLIARFGLSGVRSYRFMSEIDVALGRNNDVAEAYKFLVKQLELSPEEMDQARAAVVGATDDVELTSEDLQLLTATDLERICQDGQPLNVHLMKEVVRMKKVKEQDYLRHAGFESLTQLKAAIRSGSVTPDQQKAIVDLARDEARYNVWMSAFIVITCILGIASFILATVFSGGAFLVLGMVLMLAMNVLMTAGDGYALFQAAETVKNTSWKDKAIMVGMILLTIAAMTVGAFFSGGLVPMIIVLAVGVVMLAIQTGCMARAYYRYNPPEETPAT